MSGERMSDEEFDAACYGATGSPQPECWRHADELADEAARARASEAALREENERLRGVLKGLLEHPATIGTNGTGPDPDAFYCEFCGASDLHFTKVPHFEHCPTVAARAALSKEPTP